MYFGEDAESRQEFRKVLIYKGKIRLGIEIQYDI